MNQIAEIQIVPIKPNNGLIGFASLVLDQKIYLGSIGIHTKIEGSGYRLTYPTKKIGDKNINLYHPITRELGIVIEQAILEKANKVFKRCNEGSKNVGYDSFINP